MAPSSCGRCGTELGARPPWHPGPSPYFSGGGLSLIDLIGLHWGTIAVAAIPGAEWWVSVYPGTKRGESPRV